MISTSARRAPYAFESASARSASGASVRDAAISPQAIYDGAADAAAAASSAPPSSVPHAAQYAASPSAAVPHSGQRREEAGAVVVGARGGWPSSAAVGVPHGSSTRCSRRYTTLSRTTAASGSARNAPAMP